ncbi:putative VQ motif-containing protein/18/20/21/25 [Helianthus annuus]|uniref:VQ motif-containing protein 20-like n=1 Tax=Helianthus annuus TaxID=4232 RepID=UPI000B909373|nr:VQ motif-containing protein 20-like [Helianthus annuus]KAJ0466818.1 putative VQ motif-containing protein/18/20/21/25 [Helianthus annuus]
MSPTPFHAKQQDDDQKPPKINKDPNFIHPSPAAGSSTNNAQPPPPPPPPPPVIIYTHSPKVIHTHPRDFKALVQKLTGYTPSPEDTQPTQDQRGNEDQGNMEDNESSSVVTEEHGSPQVNSCFVDGGVAIAPPPPYNVARFDPYFNPTPVFPANTTNFLCTPAHRLPFYNPDSLLLNRNSFSSSSSSLRVKYPDI